MRDAFAQQVVHDYVAHFEARIARDEITGCWNWTADRWSNGYGTHLLFGKRQKAHRVSYEMHVGPIPDGMFVCHHCDNPPCVNPDHLFLGTPADNMADMRRKGRGRFIAPKRMRKGSEHPGAKLTEAKVVEIRALTNVSGCELARRYGVSRRLIGRIRNRMIWRHV